ncbi:DUF3265 domain-containing protein [Vibrio diabolicus]|nr:DUF3265 domain-containing protein [Vibrio diabolicus]MCJ0883177.1 DUF3265 domain-containing protein [Vibrio sp. CCB-PB317]MCR9551528.1 DUF3265 domain-containing protein [Vibrio sp. RM-41-2A]MCR9555385.1 DUF3265 domain-containing protein [Vibrio sp. RM-41-2B]MCR9624047.1 DUF3265 domain-containing protein [Vibrio sp. RM-44-3]MCR9625714.1 DUF3265 domain-containing protein [Vibrio antiquarius]
MKLAHNKAFRVICNAWHFHYTLVLVVEVLCGSISIALITSTGR